MGQEKKAAEIPEAAREDFEEWAQRVAVELDPPARVEDYAGALAFLLSEEALGPVEEYGKDLPGYYVAGWDTAGKRDRGEDLLQYLYEAYWRPEPDDDTDLRVFSGCYTDDEEGWVHGLDVRRREGFPLGTIVFREAAVYLDDFACSSEVDLYDVYKLVGSAGTPEGSS